MNGLEIGIPLILCLGAGVFIGGSIGGLLGMPLVLVLGDGTWRIFWQLFWGGAKIGMTTGFITWVLWLGYSIFRGDR